MKKILLLLFSMLFMFTINSISANYDPVPYYDIEVSDKLVATSVENICAVSDENQDFREGQTLYVFSYIDYQYDALTSPPDDHGQIYRKTDNRVNKEQTYIYDTNNSEKRVNSIPLLE